jgi:MFS family permease
MPAFAETFGELSSALHGFVVSSILIAATLASLFAGSLSNTLGRTHTIALGAFLFAVGATIAASASSLVVFVAARCIVGFGEGAFLSTLVVYVCEISPPRKRGVLASTVQLFTTLGIMMGYFTCYGTNNIQSSFAWRLPFIIQAGVAASLAVVAYAYLPQSPRWLAYKDRKEEASAAWDRLGVSDAEREKYSLESPVLGDTADASVPVAQGNILDKWKDGVQAAVKMFGKDTRRQMFLAVFMMSMQQLSGIDGVLYVCPSRSLDTPQIC